MGNIHRSGSISRASKPGTVCYGFMNVHGGVSRAYRGLLELSGSEGGLRCKGQCKSFVEWVVESEMMVWWISEFQLVT